MELDSPNPLLSTKSSDSGLSIALHPLVLLTASDQITRLRVRQHRNPTIGILLGQQKGREITAEHAFSAAFTKDKETGAWTFLEPWLEDRIQQYKDVHKAPVLEVVGWFTLGPESGPLPEMVSYQKHITTKYNDNGIMLVLHPELCESAETTNRKLPVTIYESVIETEQTKDEGSMQIDGEDSIDLTFRPIPYTIETDETEMIAINYVAKGAGSAAAVTETEPDSKADPSKTEEPKGKQRADAPPSQIIPAAEEKTITLTTDEEDQIASMTTRLNSVKMLQTRLSILSNFISSSQPSYLSDQTINITQTSPDPTHLPHLRNIQALLSRLSLLTTSSDSASDAEPLQKASKSQSNDVALASMLSLLGQDIQSLSELGRKFATVESGRSSKNKSKGDGGGGGGGLGNGIGLSGTDDFDGLVSGFAMKGGMLV